MPQPKLERYITFGYMSGLLIIAMLSAVGTFFLYKVMHSDAEATRVVNIISAQQNRIQNIALLTWALQDNRLDGSDIPLKSRLLKTVHQLETDHDFLLNKVFKKRLLDFKKEDVQAYENLDREIRTYAASARYLAQSQSIPKSKNDILVSILLEKANSNLSSKLSNLHADYVSRHTSKLETYNRLSFVNLSVIIFVLLLEGVFLFRPLVKLVKKEHASLLRSKEASDQANKVKIEFLANVSHEIRTPLAVIIGYSDMLLTSKTISKTDSSAGESIKKSAMHLKTLIDDLLDLSKIENKGIEVLDEFFDVDALMHEISSTFEVNAHEKKVSFKIVYATPLPRFITSDPVRLKQVIINLLSNAFKFTTHGEVRLSVSYVAVGNQIEFSVSDTGIGIEAEKQGKLFKRFYQVDSSLSRATGGSGIGLALSKSICETLGGDLEIQYSEVGKGSCFGFHLYAGKISANDFVTIFDPHKKCEEDHLRETKISGKLAGMNILLVEDGYEIQQIYSHFLELAGAQVHTEANGEDGFKAALRGEYDLVLMDIQMPKMDGYTATQILLNGGYRKPIIALTAHAMKEEREKCFSLGFRDYVTKPVPIAKLIHTISRYNPNARAGATYVDHAIKADDQRRCVAKDGAIPSIYENQSVYVPLIKEFCGRLPTRIQAMRALYSASDWDQLAKEAHMMKGAAASYGYPILSEYACEWEQLAKKVLTNPDAKPTSPEGDAKIAKLEGLCQRIVAGSPV